MQYRLVVRDMSTLQILQLYTCLDQISHMDWSSDSLFILCAMYKRGLVQVGHEKGTVMGVCDSAFGVNAQLCTVPDGLNPVKIYKINSVGGMIDYFIVLSDRKSFISLPGVLFLDNLSHMWASL